MAKMFCRWVDTSPYYPDIMNTDNIGHIYIYIYAVTYMQPTSENDTSKCRLFIYFITREFSEIFLPFYCLILFNSITIPRE